MVKFQLFSVVGVHIIWTCSSFPCTLQLSYSWLYVSENASSGSSFHKDFNCIYVLVQFVFAVNYLLIYSVKVLEDKCLTILEIFSSMRSVDRFLDLVGVLSIKK